MDGQGKDPSSRYLESQREILNALQSTTQRLLVDAARRNEEFETGRKAAYEKLELEFRERAEAERKKIDDERAAALDQIAKREEALKTRIEAFNTKEARYVARQKQDQQIEDLKGWLKEWNLTSGTVAKRSRVELAYVVGAVVCLGVTAIATTQGFLVVEKAKDLSSITSWQWAALTLKTTIPFALFATFLTYYIRWNGAWAKQHADEEFRNRARVIDIGRSGWLLEAVRDAQDNKQALPPELVKELSRNLFAHGTSPDADLHPQSVTDLVSQGIKSISVKGADGARVEVVR